MSSFHLCLVFIPLCLTVSMVTTTPIPIPPVESDMMETCELCQDNDNLENMSESQLRSFISHTLRMDGVQVLNALTTAMDAHGIRPTEFHTHPLFQVGQCCDGPFFHEPLNPTTMNPTEILSNVTLLIRDVLSLGQVTHLSENGVRRFNEALCAMRMLDNAQTQDHCNIAAPLASCITTSNTCTPKITLRFLRSAHIMIHHLRYRLS